MRFLLHAMFSRLIRHGALTIHWPDRTTTTYGGGAGLHAAIALADWATVRRLARDPGLAFGEAYMDGSLQPHGCDIYDVLDVILTNAGNAGRQPMLDAWSAIRRATSRLPRPRARTMRATARHYDVDEAVYRAFLDRDLQYSCAYFETGDETLEEAQTAKKHHIAAKLKLDRPGLRVLDIGCGWGGMALTLAREYGAHVTGITLSAEQRRSAENRAHQAGLGAQAIFRRADYREIEGTFDRIVSVGMLEHVGKPNYGTYFAQVRRLLKDDGVALIHSIGRSEGPGDTAAWLRKYIFPGGSSPALSELAGPVERSGLALTDLEILRFHYALTIRHWRTRFARARADIALAHDEAFCRMFEFYLAAVELAFRRQRHVNFQLQLTPALDTLPITRAYMNTQPARQLVMAE